MQNKNWKSYEMTITGLPQQVKYNEDTVKNLFLPFLRELSALQGTVERRIVVFLAAPPATGKSTLAQFLEQLSKEDPMLTNIRAVGMDGFHYPNDYLESHYTLIDGESVPMKSIKGAPETFDVDGLQAKLRAVRRAETKWPVYDRRIHDVRPNVETVDADIILVEGNWLLLKDSRWTDIRILADYSVFIEASPELLKARLIERKIQGGLSPEEAAAFYEASDRRNVERTLKDSGAADEVWIMQEDGDFVKNFDE